MQVSENDQEVMVFDFEPFGSEHLDKNVNILHWETGDESEAFILGHIVLHWTFPRPGLAALAEDLPQSVEYLQIVFVESAEVPFFHSLDFSLRLL